MVSEYGTTAANISGSGITNGYAFNLITYIDHIVLLYLQVGLP
jgi:hypothetical protein